MIVQIVCLLGCLSPAVYFLKDGLVEKKTWMAVLGGLFLLFIVCFIASLIIQRRRYPLDDIELDREVKNNLKEFLKAIAVWLLVMVCCFLFVFGVYELIK